MKPAKTCLQWNVTAIAASGLALFTASSMWLPLPCSAAAPPTATATRDGVTEESREWHARRSDYFKRTWGVDIAGVKRVASGFMLEFRYTIVDPEKAQALQLKTAKPYVIDEVTGIRLTVPALENVGELRQSAAPELDRTYYIIFGNPGQAIKPGGHVTVVIGNFRAEGLVVQ